MHNHNPEHIRKAKPASLRCPTCSVMIYPTQLNWGEWLLPAPHESLTDCVRALGECVRDLLERTEDYSDDD